MFKNQPAWGGGGGGHGRRSVDGDVAKAYYDPEDRRQRALGMGEAGLGLTGTAGAIQAGRMIRNDTKSHRMGQAMQAANVEHGVSARGAKGAFPTNEAREEHAAKLKAAQAKAMPRTKGTYRIKRKPVALAVGSAAALLGARKVNRFAESERGRKWD